MQPLVEAARVVLGAEGGRQSLHTPLLFRRHSRIAASRAGAARVSAVRHVAASWRRVAVVVQVPAAGAPRPVEVIAILSQNVVDGSQDRRVGGGRQPPGIAAPVRR